MAMTNQELFDLLNDGGGLAAGSILSGSGRSMAVHGGIVGNNNCNNTITINSYPSQQSEIAAELVKVCNSLDLRQKVILLNYALELEKQAAAGITGK